MFQINKLRVYVLVFNKIIFKIILHVLYCFSAMNHCRKIKCHKNYYCWDRKIYHCHISLPLSPLGDHFFRKGLESPKQQVNKPQTHPTRQRTVPAFLRKGHHPWDGHVANGTRELDWVKINLAKLTNK